MRSAPTNHSMNERAWRRFWQCAVSRRRSTTRPPRSSRASWRVIFAVFVIALALDELAAEVLIWRVLISKNLSASERYTNLILPASMFPLTHKVRWAPEQFALRYQIVQELNGQ